MKTYRFEEIRPRTKHLSSAVIRFFKKEGLEFISLKESGTREAYNDSDFTGWILYYGENKEQIKRDRDKLTSIIYKDKPVFGVSGNGWGTGLHISANLSSYFDDL